MSLVATVGDASANSYVTEAEAEIYMSDRVHAEDWEEFEDKAKLLITSSSIIDWYIPWKGLVATAIQSMQWPRTGVYDKFGNEFATTVIPTEVKIAVFEMALSSLEADRTADGDLNGLSEVRASTLLLKTDTPTKGYSTASEVIPAKIWKILSILTSKQFGSVRLIRA